MIGLGLLLTVSIGVSSYQAHHNNDILLITPTVHAMHIMLRVCDKFADDFDMKFNGGKSFAMRLGNVSMKNVLHCKLIIKILCMLKNSNI